MGVHRCPYPLGLAAGLGLTLLAAPEASAQPGVADVEAQVLRGPVQPEEDTRVRVLVELTNRGPDTAERVRIRARQEEGYEFERVRCGGVSRTRNSCTFRDLEPGETAQVTFVLDVDELEDGRPLLTDFRARVTSRTTDPDDSDNHPEWRFVILPEDLVPEDAGPPEGTELIDVVDVADESG